jgi:2-polyprenyl-3-methyl-5-hydroxy-6-metoxy-1,4-benzoquinol methylase
MTRPPGTLDAEALRVFAEKGLSYWADTTPNSVPPHNQNGVKVRRIMQLTADLAHKPFGELRILDLGCGEGVYAVEAGLKGASVVALDARRDRMRQGAAIAERLGLSNVSFDQMDIRTIQSAQLGSFDVIYCLGILYHLMAADAIALLRSLHAMTTGPVIIDTMIAPKGEDDIVYDGRTYAGKHVQEHPEDRPLGDRRKAILQSLDNTFSFYFTKPSLTSLLVDVGFTSVCECFAPFEPGKSADRVTMVALKGERVTVATYPWVAHRTEAELADLIAHSTTWAHRR